jgi:hypothetical protein
MTTAVALAGSRAAPYCSDRLPATNATVTASASASHAAAGGGTRAIAPSTVSAAASTPATIAPPANIASERPSSGRPASRRNMTLLNANEKPPATPSQSASERGSGKAIAPGADCTCDASGQSTISAPIVPSAILTPAERVSRSPRTTRASSTVQSGIR